MQTVALIAGWVGADPISLIIIGGLALACSLTLHFLLPASWFTLLLSPVLLVGGLTAYWLGHCAGLIETISVHFGDEGEFQFDWQFASTVLPNVVVSATIGICAVMVLVVMTMRRLQRMV